jgi:hypothetical protein
LNKNHVKSPYIFGEQKLQLPKVFSTCSVSGFLRPENILDLSCDQSRFAFCDQLQHIVNSQAVELASEVSPVSHQAPETVWKSGGPKSVLLMGF